MTRADPARVGIGDPDLAVGIFPGERLHGEVDPADLVLLHQGSAGIRIAENQELGRPERETCPGGPGAVVDAGEDREPRGLDDGDQGVDRIADGAAAEDSVQSMLDHRSLTLPRLVAVSHPERILRPLEAKRGNVHPRRVVTERIWLHVERPVAEVVGQRAIGRVAHRGRKRPCPTRIEPACRRAPCRGKKKFPGLRLRVCRQSRETHCHQRKPSRRPHAAPAGAACRLAAIWSSASTTASKVSMVEACRAL